MARRWSVVVVAVIAVLAGVGIFEWGQSVGYSKGYAAGQDSQKELPIILLQPGTVISLAPNATIWIPLIISPTYQPIIPQGLCNLTLHYGVQLLNDTLASPPAVGLLVNVTLQGTSTVSASSGWISGTPGPEGSLSIQFDSTNYAQYVGIAASPSDHYVVGVFIQDLTVTVRGV